MSKLKYIIALLVTILTMQAVAADVELAGRTVHLDPGDGFCALSATKHPLDAIRIKMVNDAQRGMNEVAGYWADCQALEDARSGKRNDLLPYVLILAQFGEAGEVVPVDATNDVYRAAMKGSIDEFMGSREQQQDARSMLVDRVNESLADLHIDDTNFSVGEFQPLGLLSEDILAYGFLAPTSQDGRDRTMAVVFAPMQLNGISFTANAYDVFHGADTVVALEATVRRTVLDLTAKNPTNLPE